MMWQVPAHRWYRSGIYHHPEQLPWLVTLTGGQAISSTPLYFFVVADFYQ